VAIEYVAALSGLANERISGVIPGLMTGMENSP
jgi:hypothetical protein